MIKKKNVTNRLYGANGGWSVSRSVNYDGEGTVHGHPYQQITPVVQAAEWTDMIEWCVVTFGPSGTEDNPGVWTPNERWYVNNGKFWFRERADQNWFMLKWA